MKDKIHATIRDYSMPWASFREVLFVAIPVAIFFLFAAINKGQTW